MMGSLPWARVLKLVSSAGGAVWEGCVPLSRWSSAGRGGTLGEELEVLCLAPLPVHFVS